jgi:hypothetical protein
VHNALNEVGLRGETFSDMIRHLVSLTLADDIRRKTEEKCEDFLYAKLRESIREHSGMI